MDTVIQDVRHALRQLIRQPGFAVVVLTTLGVAIAANTAVLTVVDAVLLRPLPYSDPARLIEVSSTTDFHGLSYLDFRDFERQRSLFEAVAAYQVRRLNVTSLAEPREVQAVCATAGLFNVLRVRPEIGRAFTAAEEGEPVAVITHRMWVTAFGGAADVVRRTVMLDGRAYAIIGVLPRSLAFPAETMDLWLPLTAALAGEDTRLFRLRGERVLEGVARLAPSTTDASLREGLDVLFRATVAQLAGFDSASSLSTPYVDVPTGETGYGWRPLQESVTGSARRPLAILTGAVVVVLLVACMNVAGMLLTRATVRRQEFGIREALGARRGQLIRQLLTESVVLALLATMLAVVAARWAIAALLAIWPDVLPRATQIAVDWRIFIGCVGGGVVTGVAFGVLPAWRATAPGIVGLLKDGATSATGRYHGAILGALTAGQVAATFVLLASAGLLIRSFIQVTEVDPGIDTGGVMAARLRLSSAYYATVGRQQEFYRGLVAELKNRRDVTAVAVTSTLPFTHEWDVEWFSPGSLKPGTPLMGAIVFRITSGYFEAVRTPVRLGRTLEERDASSAARVVVINEKLAGTLWPAENPIGRLLPLAGGPATVIGVVGNVHSWSLEEAEPMPQVYLPLERSMHRSDIWLLVRSDRPDLAAEAIAEAVWQLDQHQPIGEVAPLVSLMGRRVAARRFSTSLVTVFALCAVLLALISVYGHTAYAVGSRSRELAIRVALGANPQSVVRLLLMENLRWIALGLALGLLGAPLVTRVLAATLFEVRVLDAATYVAATLLLLFTALAATYVPAIRATRVDPVSILRS